MNAYFLMVERLIEDHFTESDKELLLQKLRNKKVGPKKMTKEQKKENYYMNYFDKFIGGK